MPEDERNRCSGKKTESCCSNRDEKKTRTVVVKAKEGKKIESYKDVSRIVLENMKKATTIQPEADTQTYLYLLAMCACVCVFSSCMLT